VIRRIKRLFLLKVFVVAVGGTPLERRPFLIVRLSSNGSRALSASKHHGESRHRSDLSILPLHPCNEKGIWITRAIDSVMAKWGCTDSRFPSTSSWVTAEVN
jgi:hypothetical protein